MKKFLSIMLCAFGFATFGQGTKKSSDNKSRGHYLDTTLFEMKVWPYYKGCYKKVSDTVYSPKYSVSITRSWEMYYDRELTLLKEESYLVGDTTKRVEYYFNGKKKEENWSIGYKWIYQAQFCDNGQMVYEGNPNDMSFKHITHYHCNGAIAVRGDWESGRVFNDWKYYYPEGSLKMIKHNQPYEKKNEPRWSDEQIKLERFDEKGNPTNSFNDTVHININVLGAPTITFNYLDKMRNLYSASDLVRSELIYGQKGYDKFMLKLKHAIYKKAKIDFKTECKCGLTYIQFIVNKDGVIEHVQITTSNRNEIDEMFVKAIKKLKKWHLGKMNDLPVNVMVHLDLAFEEVVR